MGLICPLTDKVCHDTDCKQDGCVEQREEEGEEAKDGLSQP